MQDPCSAAALRQARNLLEEADDLLRNRIDGTGGKSGAGSTGCTGAINPISQQIIGFFKQNSWPASERPAEHGSCINDYSKQVPSLTTLTRATCALTISRMPTTPGSFASATARRPV